MKKILILALISMLGISCRSYRTGGHSKNVTRDFIVEDFTKDYRDKFSESDLKSMGAGFRVSTQVELIAPFSKVNIVSFKENRLQEGHFAHFVIPTSAYGQIVRTEGNDVFWVKFDVNDSIPLLLFTLDVETKTYRLTAETTNEHPFTPGIIKDFPLASADGENNNPIYFFFNCTNGTKAYLIEGHASATLQMVKESIAPRYKQAKGVK